MDRLRGPIRSTIAAVREALSNDGIRRLELVWSIGIAADAALLVVLLVVVYAQDGVVAAGVLGAIRMVPAVIAGTLAGTVVRRFGGQRVLLTIGIVRTLAAAACAIVIALGLPTILLYVLATIGAMAGAPVRPASGTLMPGIARSPRELVAANMAWGTGEGLGTFAGPFVAGLLMAVGQPALAAAVVAFAFLATVVIVAGLRFEHSMDAVGGSRQARTGIVDGLRVLGRRRVLRWSMLGIYGQVITRGLLNTLLVVASIELLGMGEAGVGLLTSALGLGGLVGAVFTMNAARSDLLIVNQSTALAYWGAPIAVMALFVNPAVGLACMFAVGVANAMFDVVVFTIFQRGATNAERASVFSLFEGVAGLGIVTGSLLAPVLLGAFGPTGSLAITGAILPILALIIYAFIGREERVTVIDEDIVRLVKRVEQFKELPLTALERLASGMTRFVATAGQTLMREGEHGETFMIIETGNVDVSVGGQPMQQLGPGSGIGEIALLRRSLRTATVVAHTEVSGYEVDADTFACAVSGPATAAITEQIAAANLRRGASISNPERSPAAG
jgi:MFS family permease